MAAVFLPQPPAFRAVVNLSGPLRSIYVEILAGSPDLVTFSNPGFVREVPAWYWVRDKRFLMNVSRKINGWVCNFWQKLCFLLQRFLYRAILEKKTILWGVIVQLILRKKSCIKNIKSFSSEMCKLLVSFMIYTGSGRNNQRILLVRCYSTVSDRKVWRSFLGALIHMVLVWQTNRISSKVLKTVWKNAWCAFDNHLDVVNYKYHLPHTAMRQLQRCWKVEDCPISKTFSF